jgi:hypothetical protein
MKGLIGKWAFVIGVLLALLLGLMGAMAPWMAVTLVILGLIVGLLNVTSKEATPFLLAGVSLLLAASFGKAAVSEIAMLANVLNALLVFIVPTVIVVALREVFVMAKK